MPLEQVLNQIIKAKFNHALIEKAQTEQTSINALIDENPITNLEITVCFQQLGLKYTNAEALQIAKQSLRDKYKKLARTYLECIYMQQTIPNKNLPDEISRIDVPDIQISFSDFFKDLVNSIKETLRAPLKNLFIATVKYLLACTVVGLISWTISATNNHFLSDISFLNTIVTASGAQGAAAAFLSALCFGALIVGIGFVSYRLCKAIFADSSDEPPLVNSYPRNHHSDLFSSSHKEQDHKNNTNIHYAYNNTQSASSDNYSVNDYDNGIFGGFDI
jgi:hypothetical protein